MKKLKKNIQAGKANFTIILSLFFLMSILSSAKALENSNGKKLGFIVQEMGREINTTGSKANFAPMQKAVIQMKNELEQIKEQILNVL